jgi:hypothetical protein
MKSLEELKNNIYEKINEIRNFDTDGSKVFNEDETYNYDELDAFLKRHKKKNYMIDVDNTYQKQEILNEICFYIRNVTAMQIYQGKDKDTLTISLCLGVERIRLNDDELDVFRKAFRILHECNEWIKEDDERNKKERPTFNKGSRIMYTIEDENGNTHTVTRLSKRCYELKECKTLFVTDDEGVVTGIYKEK